MEEGTYLTMNSVKSGNDVHRRDQFRAQKSDKTAHSPTKKSDFLWNSAVEEIRRRRF